MLRVVYFPIKHSCLYNKTYYHSSHWYRKTRNATIGFANFSLSNFIVKCCFDSLWHTWCFEVLSAGDTLLIHEGFMLRKHLPPFLLSLVAWTISLECEPYFRDRTPSYALFYRMWSHFTLSFIVCATSMRRLYISACVCSAYFIFITLSLTMFIYLIFTISKSKLCVLVCFSENEL